jgi:hypothetical protein
MITFKVSDLSGAELLNVTLATKRVLQKCWDEEWGIVGSKGIDAILSSVEEKRVCTTASTASAKKKWWRFWV